MKKHSQKVVKVSLLSPHHNSQGWVSARRVQAPRVPPRCGIRDRCQLQKVSPGQEVPVQAGTDLTGPFGVWEGTSPTGSFRGRKMSPAKTSDPPCTPCGGIWAQGGVGGWCCLPGFVWWVSIKPFPQGGTLHPWCPHNLARAKVSPPKIRYLCSQSLLLICVFSSSVSLSPNLASRL